MMAAGDFQRALSDLIARPEVCSQVREGDKKWLDGYALTLRERRRLEDVARQRGMATCCTLYRANRLAPLWTLLPHTCLILGADLARETHLFWELSPANEMRVYEETERFARFLRGRLALGILQNPFLRETIDFETACNALRFAALPFDCRDTSPNAPISPTRTRLVTFQHDPVTMLRCFRDEQTPPADLPTGQFFLKLETQGGEICLQDITPAYHNRMITRLHDRERREAWHAR